MDRAFQTEHDATVYLREYLEEEAEGRSNEGDRPTWADEVPADMESINYSIYELVKAMRSSGTVMLADCDELTHLVNLRDAVWAVGETAWATLVAHHLRPSPEKELEMLIRNVGMGYHPDTPFHGYEPPITAYTREEWDAVHDRFHQSREPGDRDIYEFGLEVFNEMRAERLVTYPDGTRSDQVVWEEVRDAVDRWALYPVETILETLEWGKAAQDAFAETFKERYGNED